MLPVGNPFSLPILVVFRRQGMDTIPMTPDDLEVLKALVGSVKERRTSARLGMGDAHSSNDGDGWHADDFKRTIVDEATQDLRMAELQTYIDMAEIVIPEEQNLEARMGSAVVLMYPDKSSETYVLVGYACRILDPEVFEVSTRAPFAQSLLGKRYGDKIEVGDKIATVLDVLSPSETRELIARHTVK